MDRLEVLTELYGVETVWLTRDSSYKGGGKEMDSVLLVVMWRVM